MNMCQAIKCLVFLLQPLPTGAGGDGMWIGANDLRLEGKFRWAGSYTPVSYSNWGRNMPDDFRGSQDCVHMWGTEGKWNDLPCDHTDEQQVTICEVLFDCGFA